MKQPLVRREHVLALGAVVLGIGFLGALEVIEEPDMTPGQILVELIEPTVLVLTAAAVVYVLLRTNRQHVTQMSLIRSLEAARSQGSEWRSGVRDIVTGLSEAIRAQFDEWGLTAAEREVALLLLKGMSHREIAVLRKSSERTVRHQASAIYAKADLNGRAALSSYFLGELLPPNGQG